MDKSQILDNLTVYKNFSKKVEFADFLGISQQTLQGWYKRNTFDYNIVKDKFPEINDLFLRGESSDMFINGENPIFVQNRQERIKQICFFLKKNGTVKNQKDFGVKLGYPNECYFSTLINMNDSLPLPAEFILNLKKLMPTLNIKWLEKGVGDMLEDSSNNNVSDEDNYFSESKTAPLIPIEIARNPNISIRKFNEQNNVTKFEPSKLYPFFDFQYKVTKNNMKPFIERGDIVYVKRIEKENIIDNDIYLIDTEKFGIVIYRVKKNNDTYTCIPACEEFGTIEININDIYDTYSIEGIFKYCANNFNTEEKILREELKTSNNHIDSLLCHVGNLIDIIKNK